jgi:HlyD family secretion protein
MTPKKLIIAGLVVVGLAAIAYANIGFTRQTGTEVSVETIEGQDLEAIVTASGTVQPSQQVNISAETMGKVVSLYVVEGQIVKRGQRLLQIDPTNLDTVVRNRQASLESSKVQLAQTQAQIESARINLEQAQVDLARDEKLWEAALLPREQYDRSVNAVKTAETQLRVQERSADAQEQRINQAQADLESATYDLSKLTPLSPIDGIVTRRNIEEGETAVVGTMNNAGTVLLTIADLAVIETEIEVDETDIPFINLGQPAVVTIDAIPDVEFPGRVTEVGNSPIQTQAGASRATNFKVVVTIDGEVPGVRPGFTCTAVITTATREQSVAVPIQAMAIREMVVDAEGNIVRRDVSATEGRTSSAARRRTQEPDEAAGETLEEIEGAFIVEDGRAKFVPVEIGIAGERYFEVLTGLDIGDVVITGPFASVRNLRDGDEVRVTDADDDENESGGGLQVQIGSGD